MDCGLEVQAESVDHGGDEVNVGRAMLAEIYDKLFSVDFGSRVTNFVDITDRIGSCGCG